MKTKQKPKEKGKKKLSQKLGKEMQKFIPFRYIVNEDCIACDDYYCDYLKIGDSQASEGDLSEKQLAIEAFHTFLNSVTTNIKFLFSSFPVDLGDNIEYAQQRFGLNQQSNDNVIKEQQAIVKMLEYLDHNRMIDFAYVQYFADSQEELASLQRTLLSASSQGFKLEKMEWDTKAKLMYRFYNPSSSLPTGPAYGLNDITGRPPEIQKILDKKGYDPAFLSYIQPMGGIKEYDSKTLQISKGFIRVMNLQTYRPKKNRAFWGERTFRFKNVMTSLDVHNVDVTNPIVENSLNTSLTEYEDRAYTARNQLGKKKAIKEYQALDATIEGVMDSVESIKQIHVRFVLCEDTIDRLNEKEKEIIDRLNRNKFQAVAFLDEQEVQYRCFFLPYDKGNELINRKGKDIKSSSLAGSFPFNSSNHIDPTAPYTGYPLYGSGLVALSTNYRDAERKAYGVIIVGAQGFGKSTLGKDRQEKGVLYNNNSFGFFVSDESERNTRYLGGEHINARDPEINPCQIYPVSVDNKTLMTKEKDSFEQSLNSMYSTFLLARGLDEKDSKDKSMLREAKRIFRKGYEEHIYKHNLRVDKITQYDSEQYMRYSDFLDVVTRERNGTVEEFRKKDLYDFSENLQEMIHAEGGLFNTFSSFTLQDKRFVNFNLEDLLKSEENIYNAQYYNLYNMVFSESVKVGQHEKYLYDIREKKPSELIFTDITHDEFHNPIRTKNLKLINRIDRDNREGRKIMIGETLISQELGDMFPNFAENGRLDDEISKAVMNLFKLSPYRFIFRQDVSSRELFHKVFGEQLSPSDLNDIFTDFRTGECLLNIRGVKNIKMKHDLRDEQLVRFSGGL